MNVSDPMDIKVSEDGCIEIYPTGEIYTEQTIDSYLTEKYRQAGMCLCLACNREWDENVPVCPYCNAKDIILLN